MQAKSSALASAKTVTIVGAGATGIELACDICHFYPQTKVRSMLDRECHPVPFWLTLCACSMLKLSCAAKLALPRPLHIGGTIMISAITLYLSGDARQQGYDRGHVSPEGAEADHEAPYAPSEFVH